MTLELTQRLVIAGQLAIWLPDTLPVPVWKIIGSYWFRGVFDQHDLLASQIGGRVALINLAETDTCLSEIQNFLCKNLSF